MGTELHILHKSVHCTKNIGLRTTMQGKVPVEDKIVFEKQRLIKRWSFILRG